MNENKHYNRVAATKLALIAAVAAGVFSYLVNGHDLLRSGSFALLTLAAAWYGGKVIYAKPVDGIARD